MVTTDLFETKVIWNKDHDIINSVYDFSSKILFRDSNYIVEVVKWPCGQNLVTLAFIWEKLS